VPGSRDQALAELASSQFGLFTAVQAASLGFGAGALRHRVDVGRWVTVHPGVFAVGGAPASTERSLLAACLLGGTGTLVSRRSAAWLWNLPGGSNAPVEVVSPRWQRVQRHGVRAHETRVLDEMDRSQRFGIPVTSPCRTIIDCCAVLHAHRAGAMLDDARRRGLVSLGAFARRVDELAAPGRNGIRLARRLATDRNAPPASVFESRLDDVLQDAGLPAPVRGFRVALGGDHYEIDFAFPDRRLAIEADSEAFHLDLDAFHRDRRKQNALVLAGWTILRFTWADLSTRARDVAGEVCRALTMVA
jgi:very-short-patch-repair endonuclease